MTPIALDEMGGNSSRNQAEAANPYDHDHAADDPAR